MPKASQEVLHGERKCYLNRPDPTYGNNSIRTSKYTLWNFAVLNLFEQFKKPANVYFLVLTCLQIVRPISISDGQPTILLPLTFVIVVAMIKDFLEDWKRTKADREENKSPVTVFKGGQWITDYSENLLSGEYVMVKRDQFIPADLTVLWTSSHKHDCFIETKNLDGETNLKTKGVHSDIRQVIKDKEDVKLFDGVEFNYEAPNVHLYDFSGSMTTESGRIPIDNNNILLRGCRLKNTDAVIGVIIFTGHFTKIMMNGSKAKPKHSDLERKLGFLILLVFIMLVVFCMIASILYVIWYNENHKHIGYIQLGDLNMIAEFFTRLGNWILIFG
jgi:phospholipid-transporting ATPase